MFRVSAKYRAHSCVMSQCFGNFEATALPTIPIAPAMMVNCVPITVSASTSWVIVSGFMGVALCAGLWQGNDVERYKRRLISALRRVGLRLVSGSLARHFQTVRR